MNNLHTERIDAHAQVHSITNSNRNIAYNPMKDTKER